MDFSVSEKMQTILGMMKEFVQKELIPLEAETLNKSFSEILPALEEKRKMVKQMELWSPLMPKEYGGMELPLTESALVFEALGGTPFGLFVFGCQAPDAGNIEIIHQYGTEEQKEKWLRPLINGEIRSCFSMTEVDLPGSNPVMMDTTAEKDGDDLVPLWAARRVVQLDNSEESVACRRWLYDRCRVTCIHHSEFEEFKII